MWSYLVVLLSFFNEFQENMFPAHLQVRPGVWAMRKSHQIFGKASIFGPMDVGELMLLWGRFEHAVGIISIMIFIINLLWAIYLRMNKRLRKDKKEDGEDREDKDAEDDDENDECDYGDDECDCDNGDDECDCDDDDDGCDCDDRDDGCHCDNGDDECDCDNGDDEYGCDCDDGDDGCHCDDDDSH